MYQELLATGVDIDGFTLSEDALTELRETAAERDLEPSVWTVAVWVTRKPRAVNSGERVCNARENR